MEPIKRKSESREEPHTKKIRTSSHILDLPKDTIHEICNLLPYAYIISLSFTCKELRNKIKECGADDFNKVAYRFLKFAFKEKGTDEFIQKFLDVTRRSGACISGSFVFSCLYDLDPIIAFNSVGFHDIDIIMPVPNHESYRHADPVQTRIECKEKFPIYYFLGDNDSLLFPSFHGMTHLSDSPVMEAMLAEVNYILVNLIMVYYFDTASKWIAYSFDMDILKNMYDGNKLSVWDWNIIFKKEDYIIVGNISSVLYNGLISVTDINEHAALMEKRCEEREKKYKMRGVKIQRHPAHKEMFQQNIEDSERFRSWDVHGIPPPSLVLRDDVESYNRLMEHQGRNCTPVLFRDPYRFDFKYGIVRKGLKKKGHT
jgi:hypothetical protein